MRKLRQFAAGLIAGLAAMPAFRSATVEPAGHRLEDADRIADSEIEATCFASSHPEYLTRYDGPRIEIPAQLQIAHRGRGLRFRNICLTGDREFREFVAARTIEG